MTGTNGCAWAFVAKIRLLGWECDTRTNAVSACRRGPRAGAHRDHWRVDARGARRGGAGCRPRATRRPLRPLERGGWPGLDHPALGARNASDSTVGATLSCRRPAAARVCLADL